MENLQEKYKKFFGGVCYAFCLVKKFKPEANDIEIAWDVLDGWDVGYLEDDGYVCKPVQFINNVIDAEDIVIDIEKVSINTTLDIPTGATICEMKQPNGKASHFVICHRENNEIVLDFDPSYPSKSWELQNFVSWRKFITR